MRGFHILSLVSLIAGTSRCCTRLVYEMPYTSNVIKKSFFTEVSTSPETFILNISTVITALLIYTKEI